MDKKDAGNAGANRQKQVRRQDTHRILYNKNELPQIIAAPNSASFAKEFVSLTWQTVSPLKKSCDKYTYKINYRSWAAKLQLILHFSHDVTTECGINFAFLLAVTGGFIYNDT